MNASSKNTIKLAVVGAGLVGRRHVTAIEQLSGVSLSAIVDTSDDAIAYAAENKVPVFSSLSDLFNDHKPDGVILSTPTNLHVEQGLACVEAGCPMLVEKPLATISADGERLVVAAETAGVPILVGHHRRHNPLIHRARALIVLVSWVTFVWSMQPAGFINRMIILRLRHGVSSTVPGRFRSIWCMTWIWCVLSVARSSRFKHRRHPAPEGLKTKMLPLLF